MIHAYTDGSCHVSNPGPAGAGYVIVQDGQELCKKSIPLGNASNNFAELTAISASLTELKSRNLLKDIVIITDSQYCIGVLSQDWKPKVNQELIKKIKTKLLNFQNLSFKWVRGHDGDFYNEIADQLANEASDKSIEILDSKNEVEDLLIQLFSTSTNEDVLLKLFGQDWVNKTKGFLGEVYAKRQAE